MRKKPSVKPTIKLSNEQRRVALSRMIDKQGNSQQQPPAIPPQGLAGGLAQNTPSQLPPGSMQSPPQAPLGMEGPPMGPPPGMGIGGPPMPPMGMNGPPPGPPSGIGNGPGDLSIAEEPELMKPMPDELDTPTDTNPGELSPVEMQIQSALIADQLWKDMGGDESMGSSMWDKLRKEAKGDAMETPKDYFMSSFIKYKTDPGKFRKNFPKEANLISQLADEFEASVSASKQPVMEKKAEDFIPQGLGGL